MAFFILLAIATVTSGDEYVTRRYKSRYSPYEFEYTVRRRPSYRDVLQNRRSGSCGFIIGLISFTVTDFTSPTRIKFLTGITILLMVDQGPTTIMIHITVNQPTPNHHPTQSQSPSRLCTGQTLSLTQLTDPNLCPTQSQCHITGSLTFFFPHQSPYQSQLPPLNSDRMWPNQNLPPLTLTNRRHTPKQNLTTILHPIPNLHPSCQNQDVTRARNLN